MLLLQPAVATSVKEENVRESESKSGKASHQKWPRYVLNLSVCVSVFQDYSGREAGREAARPCIYQIFPYESCTIVVRFIICQSEKNLLGRVQTGVNSRRKAAA